MEEAGETADEKALYRLIRLRSLASQLEDAVYAVRTLQLGVELDGRQALFEAKGRTLLSSGWKILVKADQAEDTEDASQELENPVPAMENVPRLIEQNVFSEFVTGLESNGYSVLYQVVDCSKYGVPQHRNRLVLLASKLGKNISLISPAEFGGEPKTVKEAIGALPPLEAGTSHPLDRLHQSSALSATNLKRIKASRPGGT